MSGARRSERSNKGKLPSRFKQYSMSQKGTSDSGDENSDLERTIIENDTTEMEAVIENLKLQMEELRNSLEAERSRNQELSDRLEQSISATHPAATQITPPNQEVAVPGPSTLNTNTPPFSTNHQQQYINTTTSPNVTPFQNPMNSPISQAGIITSNLPFTTPTHTMQSSTNTMKKIIDLPNFCGKPEDWPAFFMAYKESTENIGYSNWENHLRLTKALTGEAKESVASLLIHPNNVQMVMTELERQFGQNEHLLRSQLEKAKKIQAIPENRLDLLIPFATKVRNLAAFLESMNSLPHLANPNLIDELVRKLPSSKMIDWGMFAITVKPYVTVRHFSDWVSKLAHVVSLVNIATPTNESTSSRRQTKGVLHVSAVPKKELKCTLCKGSHALVDCSQFGKLSLAERWSTVKSNRLCFSCLRFGHATFNCRSRRPCNISGCKRSHNPLLHNTLEDEPTSNQRPNGQSTVGGACHLVSRPDEVQTIPSDVEVLFKILPVVLYSANGSSMETFALIDEGSSITLVDNSVLRKLNIEGKPERLQLQWFGNNTSTEESQVVDFEISSSIPNSPKYQLKNVHSVNNIDLPAQTLSLSKLSSKYQAMKKLPISQYENAKPLLLIGLDNGFLGAPRDSSRNKLFNNEPIAVNTRLGWMVYGPYESGERIRNVSLHIRSPIVTSTEDERFDDIIENYFTAESFGVKIANTESTADRKAMELLKSTTVKIGERYQTGLLWKNPEVVLPPSFEMAKNRLLSIEKKMASDGEFAERYKDMINSFIRKGYARKLSPMEAAVSTKKTWYLPHFSTSNPNKPGKHRLVFDAAARAGGVSLNDNLLKGPDMYNSLVSVLFNFRSREVAVSADITEMFSQIRIQPSDLHAQRFLWRDGDPNMPIDIYVMESMTFGVTCSPASAHHVKNFNALSFKEEYPQAVNSILHHHYVDDFVDSFDSIEDAKRISSEVSAIHSSAGFNLRGFISNSPEVAEFLNGYHDANSSKPDVKQMNLEGTTTEKILGLIWDTQDDCFKFKLRFNKVNPDVIEGARRPSKRELLSIIMSVFDPFGFLSNLLIHPKLMMQELWRRQLSWDEPVPEDINNQWLQWRESLEKVKLFKLPRYYFSGVPSVVDIQLHTLVDASQDAFAAVTYLRVHDGSRVTVRLMSAKTRCAPVKQLMSIPRLELQAAVMGSRISSTVETSLNFQISRRVFWSDSATVVSWIRSDHRRYKPFVAHRISEILETTKPSEWRWIPTKLNVSDQATRAKYPIHYDPEDSWVNGPKFLLAPEDQWPSKIPNESVQIDEELKSKHVHITVPRIPLFDFSKYSSFLKLKRVVAWVKRFINNKCHPSRLQSGELTVSELQQAEIALCLMVQEEAFGQELRDLTTKQLIKRSSSIYKLTPIISSDGLLRLNGRIGKPDIIPSSTKRPIIMPRGHPLTTLIVSHYHSLMRHQNRNAIISEVQRKFWIPRLKSLVNHVKFQCQICKNRSARPNPPMMSELPFDRVTAFVRPFTYSGVDYFGPYDVSIGRRREKRWVALFTCLTTRAIHLELAADMSTDAFLLCVRNFVNRRGIPVRIRSDNGTNFTGAQKDRIRSELSTKNIEWLFNCPDNPHAGGSWERLVQAVKRVLSYTLHSEAPRVETFRSLLIEAENIVNSRPLTDVPISHEDEDPISPNHFLIGGSNFTQTPGPVNEKTWCMRKQWRIAQQLKNRFWKKWVAEFLPTIIRRDKWIEKVRPLAVGDLVLLVDPDVSRTKWCKGRIIEVFPGSDGQVRSAKVKTSTGVLKRPAVKLAVMDVSSGGESPETLLGAHGDSRGGV